MFFAQRNSARGKALVVVYFLRLMKAGLFAKYPGYPGNIFHRASSRESSILDASNPR
jgi:hypothetical protein